MRDSCTSHRLRKSERILRLSLAIKQITAVFREGAGYDPERLLKTIRGLIGVR